ncbi:diacylglycerol/lipid kinase family protein [Oceanirhabdus sp. W0125-5]|uniref:diacylglycerol/lipid kinase family protein n=1 Tax=Oceanirhabdus sp. W0125-5 TaxID=2999116 RepID=UPI0022F31EE6|nr:diacylglycerol kinase family protein [Oceanirhabdus sp. W0125-5]WBW95139.1 diacylglycerol kinase family lipid kinase [Oceanirhabdus sp. W0125-5]
MRHIFILNPNSGKSKACEYIPIIDDVFKNRKDDYEIIKTEYEGHAIEIAKNFSKTDDVRLYAIGGDGTINEVINGVDTSNVPIGVIPAGSGNDFIKSAYNNLSTDFKEIIESLVDGDTEYVSLGKINDTYFVNIFSIGFDTYVVKNARLIKKLPLIPGSIAYLLSIFITLLTYRKQNIKISIDGKQINTKVFLTAFGLGKFYGGGMKVLPNAVINDDTLDICIVHSISKIAVLFLFPKLIKGEHLDKKMAKYITYKKTSNFQITSDKPMLVNRDGELYTYNNIDCSIISKGFLLIKPKVNEKRSTIKEFS